MEENAYVMESLAGVIYFVLGVRVYWLSRRSVQLSDSFLGLALLTWALGYALYDIPYALSDPYGEVPPFFAYSSMLAINLGNVVLAMFIQEVFRKHEHWAGWLIVAIATCMLLGSAGTAWKADWEQVEPLENPGYWPQMFANLVPAFWLGYEGLTRYLVAHKRVALGFLDPLARQRILLLGLVGALWAVLETVVVIQDFVYINLGDWSEALGIANGLLEIVPMIILWFAYLPPARYRRWIEAPQRA